MKKLLFILAFFAAFASQAQVKVLGYIVPNATSDQYPTHVDIYGQGGLQSVNTVVERNAITPLRRKKGMLVYVADSVKMYQLGNDLTTWTVANLGGSGSNGGTEIDPVFTSHIAYSITQQKIDLWNQIARLYLYSPTDTMLLKIDSAARAHDYTFDSVWFTVDANRKVFFNGLSNYIEQDPIFTQSAASTISQDDIDRWNANLDLSPYLTAVQTRQEISDSLRKYKYYFDGKTILGSGTTPSDPFHIVPFGDTTFNFGYIYTKSQVDSAIAANFREYFAGYGLLLENQTFRVDTSVIHNGGGGTSVDTTGRFVTSSFVSNDSLFYVKGGAAVFAGMVNRGRFGIEDNTGIVDRLVDMQSHGFELDNLSYSFLEASSSNGRTGLYSDINGNNGEPIRTELYAINQDGSQHTTLKIKPDNSYFAFIDGANSSGFYVNFPTGRSGAAGQADTSTFAVSVNGIKADATGNITVSTGGGGGGGTVTSVSASGGYGLTTAVTNPTTTPSIAMQIDSSKWATTTNLNTRITNVSNQFLDSFTNVKNTITANKQVNSDWNATSGVAQILNKPTIYTPSTDSVDYSISTYTTIYNENGPGEATVSSSSPTINPDNFNFPLRQLKSLDVGGWTQNDYISFTYPVVKNATAYTFIRGFIRLKQPVPVNQSLGIQFFNNGVAVSQRISIVNYGLDKNLINQYQNIVIQMNAFGFTSNSFNEVRLNFGGVGTVASGLYLDLFQFQNATAQENSYVTDVYRVPGTTQVKKIIGGQILDAFTDSVGSSSTSTGDMLFANYIVNETLSGTVNGTNKVFTFANATVANKEMIFINGVKQTRGVDYTMTNSTTATFTVAPITDSDGTDYLEATYFKQ